MKMKHRMKKHSLKFVSAFLALFLWVYVLNSEKVKFEKTVALDYNLPKDVMFAEKPLQEVIFLIEGPRAFVKTVAERDDKLVIDLNRANTRRKLNFTVDINPTQLELPFGMVVERVLPRKIQIRLEKKVSKILPIKPKFSGQLPDQLSLEKYEVIPSEVEVHGPQSLLSKMKEISTRPIELDNMMGMSEVPVELRLQEGRLSVDSPTTYKLSYHFKGSAANFVLKNLPIRFLTQNKMVTSTVKGASVRLLVPEKMKNRSNISSSVQVWADIPNTVRGMQEVPLKAIVPPGVHLLEISPKTIIVNVQ